MVLPYIIRLRARNNGEAKSPYQKDRNGSEDRHRAKNFDPWIGGDHVTLYIRREIWEQETCLDDEFPLKTNMHSEKITKTEVVRFYKESQTLKRALRKLKDFLRVRPL